MSPQAASTESRTTRPVKIPGERRLYGHVEAGYRTDPRPATRPLPLDESSSRGAAGSRYRIGAKQKHGTRR